MQNLLDGLVKNVNEFSASSFFLSNTTRESEQTFPSPISVDSLQLAMYLSRASKHRASFQTFA